MKRMFLLLMVVSLAACEKENEPGVTIYSKGQTQCNDKWLNGTDEETLKNMTAYLKEKGIIISKAELTKPPQDRVFCAACNCPTGRTYFIKVDQGSEKVLNEEGFYR